MAHITINSHWYNYMLHAMGFFPYSVYSATLFSALWTPFGFFHDVNYPISFQTFTLDGVTSFLLLKTLKTHVKTRVTVQTCLTGYVQNVRILKESEVSVHIVCI